MKQNSFMSQVMPKKSLGFRLIGLCSPGAGDRSGCRNGAKIAVCGICHHMYIHRYIHQYIHTFPRATDDGHLDADDRLLNYALEL